MFNALATHSGVMRGLDPRIHDETQYGTSLQPSLLQGLMDCRVKPGNDSGKAARTIALRWAGAA